MKHKFPKSKGPAKIQHSASSAKTTVQSAVRPEDNIYRGKFHYSKSKSGFTREVKQPTSELQQVKQSTSRTSQLKKEASRSQTTNRQVAAKSNFSSQLDNNNQPATLGIIKYRRRRRQRQPSPPTLSYASTW